MLAAVTGAVAKKAVELGCTLVQKKFEQWRGFEDDVEDIKADLEMIVVQEEDLILRKGDLSKVMIQSMEEMRGLAQKIEDSLDGILCYAKSSPLHRFKKVSSNMGSPPFADRVKKLKKRLKAAKQRAVDFNVNGSQPSTLASARLPIDDYSSRCPGIRKPVGINKPKEEILELLGDINGQTEQLTVICIVGFGGSGKSTLADAVYQDEKKRRPSSCWIDARQHKDDNKRLRKSITDKIVLRQEIER